MPKSSSHLVSNGSFTSADCYRFLVCALFNKLMAARASVGISTIVRTTRITCRAACGVHETLFPSHPIAACLSLAWYEMLR